MSRLLSGLIQPIRRRIGLQLLLAGLGISFISLSILGLFGLYTARTNLDALLRYNHALGLNQVAGNASAMLAELERALDVLAAVEGPEFVQRPVREQEWSLYATLARLPHVEQIWLVDGRGAERATVSRRHVAPMPHTFEGSPEARALRERRTFVGPVRLGDANQPVFNLVLPLLPLPDGQATGGIVASVSLRGIVDAITSIPAGDRGYIFLVDADGRLIGHEDFSQVLRGQRVQASLPPGDHRAAPGPSGQHETRIYRSYTGERVIGASAPVPGTDWLVIAEQPTREAYAPFRTVLQLYASGVGLIISLAAVVILLFGQGLAKRLERLDAGLRRVAAGDLSQPLPQSGEDELGNVYKAVNQLSQELKRKREMEAAVRQADKQVAIGVLAAGVAHEINNPLATISLSAEHLLTTMRASPNGVQQELAEHLPLIQNQAERGAQITRQLLDFARQTEQQQELIQLTSALQATLGLLRYRMRAAKVELETTLDDRIPPFLGDGPGLQQVLFNLVSNAIDAMPLGGRLRIESRLDQGDSLLIIQDSGTGIAPEELPRIFEPFFTTKPVGKGTGLGLSVCQGIVARAGGSILVESRLGEGTRVTVRLPLEREKGGIDDEPSASAAAGG